MDHLQNIPYAIVHILLRIVAHSSAITRHRQIGSEFIMGGRRMVLSNVLPARGTDQLVNGIVHIIAGRINYCIVEENSLLCGISDMGNVTYRIKGVLQFLK